MQSYISEKYVLHLHVSVEMMRGYEEIIFFIWCALALECWGPGCWSIPKSGTVQDQDTKRSRRQRFRGRNR